MKILSYIKFMNFETIKAFDNYSRIYPLIIELESCNDSDNKFENICNIIKNASFKINQDTEEFIYHSKDDKDNIIIT